MLNNIGLPGLLLLAVVVLVLFGRGKVSSLMGEVGKGITAFKRGVKDGAEEFERGADDARTTETRVITPADAESRSRDPRDVTPADRDRA